MKQLIQNLRSGETVLEEIPAPMVKKGNLLIRTNHSLVSLGTEKMLVEFGRSNLISKARQQPEKVKQVLDKIKTDGLLPTLETVFNKLDEPLPLGYCNAGTVIAVGDGVSDFKVGDRVVSNGGHAEFVCVPQNLCAHIPDNISFEEASFTVIGAIGLQGIRLIEPSFGETVVVIGLGLIGLITADLLKANGCRVIGFDFDEAKVNLAKSRGIIAYNSSNGLDVVSTVLDLTKNAGGADAVIITASTKSNDVISQSAKMSRKRGRIVLVGVIGLSIDRSDFYKKELSFQVSCSYGPGRYDENYENKGQDYPLAFVRWTQKRNFEAILEALSRNQISVKDLITEIVDFENYMQVYGQMGGNKIASLLKYKQDAVMPSNQLILKQGEFKSQKGVIGIIGAGNFTKMTMLPAMKGLPVHFKYIASAGGLSSKSLASKYGFNTSTTDYQTILKDSEVDLVMVTTRHNSHAQIVEECLNAGKHVFVEKPLAIHPDQLKMVVDAQNANPSSFVTVGFNRRFAPHVRKAKQLLGVNNTPALNIIATMNAGFIDESVWVQDMQIGGGRIIGEACHFIDLMTYLTGSLVESVHMNALGSNPAENTDNAIISLKFANGSQGVINYFSNGNKAYPKERVEIHSQGKTIVIDNFRKIEAFGFKGFSKSSGTQDKGHKDQFKALVDAVKVGSKAPISFEEILNTSQASFAAIESLKTGQVIHIK